MKHPMEFHGVLLVSLCFSRFHMVHDDKRDNMEVAQFKRHLCDYVGSEGREKEEEKRDTEERERDGVREGHKCNSVLWQH